MAVAVVDDVVHAIRAASEFSQHHDCLPGDQPRSQLLRPLMQSYSVVEVVVELVVVIDVVIDVVLVVFVVLLVVVMHHSFFSSDHPISKLLSPMVQS